MALNVKVALVVCVAFIGGMCWVVDMVARPVLAMPAPAVVDAAADEGGRFLRSADGPAGLAYESPVAKLGHTEVGRLPEVVAPPTRYHRPLPPMIASLASDPATADAVAVEDAPAVHEPPLRRAVPLAKLPADAQLLEIDEVGVDDAAADSGVAVAADVQVDPSAATDETVPAPGGTGAVRLASAGMPAEPAVATEPEVQEYTIQAGDTLARIAKRAWGRNNPNALAILQACNPELRDANLIVEGDRLLIPPFEVAKAMRDRQLEAAARQVAAEAPENRVAQRMYTVRESDTLSKIAAKELHDSRRWVEIARLNNMKDADQIRPGTTLLLPEVGNDT